TVPAVFQCGDAILQRLSGWVRSTGILISLMISGSGLLISRRLVNGRHHRPRSRVGMLARMNGFRCKLHGMVIKACLSIGPRKQYTLFRGLSRPDTHAFLFHVIQWNTTDGGFCFFLDQLFGAHGSV